MSGFGKASRLGDAPPSVAIPLGPPPTDPPFVHPAIDSITMLTLLVTVSPFPQARTARYPSILPSFSNSLLRTSRPPTRTQT